MKEIYETDTLGKYIVLVGKISSMWRIGKTPDEIAEAIKQPVDKVLECIEICKKAEQKRSETK